MSNRVTKCQQYYYHIKPTVFHRPWNFETSGGIYPLVTKEFYVSMEFCKIWKDGQLKWWLMWWCTCAVKKHPSPYNNLFWGPGVVICLGQGADVHMAQLMPLPLTISRSSKSRLVLPFWYWLTRVIPEKGPLNWCRCCRCLTGLLLWN